ncbi:MAG TPA: SGNH/GDSL hydrolase family protein [Bryobacteraceae bacterium]|nr:SGNH/GDSL hydrolase family protein [Bryobacteraceae bacterium]
MRQTIYLLFAAALTIAGAAGADDFALKNGDRVVFYGDSITDQRLYTVLTETYVVTRYPSLNVSFVHSGWGGDRVAGGGGGPIDTRLPRDVFAYKPTVMTIMLGMNDGEYAPESEAVDKKYFDGYRHIVDSVRAALPGIRITAIRPSPYDDVTHPPNFPGGYNETMISYGKWIANYAKEAGLNVADLNTGVVAMLEKAYASNPEEARKIIPDRVHPSFSGHLIMAEELLKSWNARAVVSEVTIDASGARLLVKTSEHVAISDLAAGPVSWTELDDALPLPLKSWESNWGAGPLKLVIASSDVADALNRQTVRVTGLASGVYTLQIDGAAVGTWNDGELARGINLGLLDTPMAKQARQVYDLTEAHCDIHNDRWRTVQVPLADYKLAQTEPTMDAMDALEKAVVEKRNEAAQPKPHKFALIPVK